MWLRHANWIRPEIRNPLLLKLYMGLRGVGHQNVSILKNMQDWGFGRVQTSQMSFLQNQPFNSILLNG